MLQMGVYYREMEAVVVGGGDGEGGRGRRRRLMPGTVQGPRREDGRWELPTLRWLRRSLRAARPPQTPGPDVARQTPRTQSPRETPQTTATLIPDSCRLVLEVSIPARHTRTPTYVHQSSCSISAHSDPPDKHSFVMIAIAARGPRLPLSPGSGRCARPPASLCAPKRSPGEADGAPTTIGKLRGKTRLPRVQFHHPSISRNDTEHLPRLRDLPASCSGLSHGLSSRPELLNASARAPEQCQDYAAPS